jgi:hypothetical protein
MGVVYPMNAVWLPEQRASLLAKIDNDTLVPADLLRRLAECHLSSSKLGVLSGFHFRQEGESLIDGRVRTIDGLPIVAQPYVGGCAVMIRQDVFRRLGPIATQTAGSDRPFMDCGWTMYQQQVEASGLVNGYPWPLVHVDHMEDTRSQHCVRTPEHEQYKHELRGMSLDEFTRELCVWRPNETHASAAASA